MNTPLTTWATTMMRSAAARIRSMIRYASDPIPDEPPRPRHRRRDARRHRRLRRIRRHRTRRLSLVLSERLSWPPAASARERRRAQPRARPAIFVARRREDVEHDAARAERAAAVRHVRRRLPEVAGLHVVLDAVLDADPLALEADAPLLVRMRVHGRGRVRLERHDRQHRVHAGEHARVDAGRELPDDAALAEVVKHGISFRRRLQTRPEPLY